MAIGKQRSRRRRSRAGFILSVLFFVGFLLVSIKGYELLFDYAKSEQTFPISRVTVEGEFEFLTKEEIIDTVAKIAAGKNLVALDLAPVHNALLRMPWPDINRALPLASQEHLLRRSKLTKTEFFRQSKR